VKPQMKVQAARYALMKQRPYLATATIRLRMVASEACPHALAASEGWTLYYNPTVVEQTELETLVIQLRREVERLIRRHARRLKSLPREVAETASAMEVDDDLAGEYGSRPDWTLPQQMGLEAGRTAEEYALALLDMLSQTGSCQSRVAQEGDQEGDSDAGSSGAGADSSSDEESDRRDGASADAPTPSADDGDGDSSANATDSSQCAGTPADGDGNDQTRGACGRSRGDSSSQQPPSGNAGDSSQSGGGASGAQTQNGACDAQRSSDQAGDDNARDSDPAPESSSSQSQQGSAASGRPAPWETDEDPASQVEIDQLVESTLQAAAEYAKTRGAQGANMARRYDAATKNKPLPWQRILARYIAQGRVYGAGRLDYSYSRPHRRQSVVQDVVLPTLRQPLLDVAVIVDTSGSISDDELGLALREVQAILKRGGVAEMRVVFGDTRIRAEARVRTVAEAVKAFRRVRGGGGTDMGHLVREVVDAKNPKSRPPQLVVVITDGETPWGRAPRTRVPVVAVITPRGRRDNTPAWVKEVVIDGEERA
jgi:predicted metal-dependent peptidase